MDLAETYYKEKRDITQK